MKVFAAELFRGISEIRRFGAGEEVYASGFLSPKSEIRCVRDKSVQVLRRGALRAMSEIGRFGANSVKVFCFRAVWSDN